MKPFYWRGTRNFGDYLNSWLWPKLLPELISENDQTRLVGIGSLLKGSLNYVGGRKIIFGTGSGYGAIPPPNEYKDWLFYFVRGPATANCFKLDESKSIIDGAWLLSLLPEFNSFRSEKRGTLFIPHWTSAETGCWVKACHAADLTYVDPQEDLLQILSLISSSELVITESLHGAILADLFRTPWIPVRISPKFLPFKWIDWFQSIEIEPEMRDLPLSDLFEYFYHQTNPLKINYKTEPYLIPDHFSDLKPKETLPSSPLYKYYIKSKTKLRSIRRNAIKSCSSIRNTYPLSKWNHHHYDKVIKCLKSVKQARPFLSDNRVFVRKIHQLEEVTDKLKKDYHCGKLI